MKRFPMYRNDMTSFVVQPPLLPLSPFRMGTLKGGHSGTRSASFRDIVIQWVNNHCSAVDRPERTPALNLKGATSGK